MRLERGPMYATNVASQGTLPAIVPTWMVLVGLQVCAHATTAACPVTLLVTAHADMLVVVPQAIATFVANLDTLQETAH